MWQRKQTIYLILTVVLLAALIFLPLAELMPSTMGMPKAVYCLRIWDCNTNSNIFGFNSGLIAIPALAAILSLVTIFLFSNRRLQMNLCRLGELLMILWYALFAAVIYVYKDGSIKWMFGTCLPIVTLIIYQLAYKGVKHDDDLVRSADRIR